MVKSNLSTLLIILGVALYFAAPTLGLNIVVTDPTPPLSSMQVTVIDCTTAYPVNGATVKISNSTYTVTGVTGSNGIWISPLLRVACNPSVTYGDGGTSGELYDIRVFANGFQEYVMNDITHNSGKIMIGLLPVGWIPPIVDPSKPTYVLTMNVAPLDGGLYLASPLQVSPVGSGRYALSEGTVVTVTAYPNEGYKFVYYYVSGGLFGVLPGKVYDSTLVLTIMGNITVTTCFEIDYSTSDFSLLQMMGIGLLVVGLVSLLFEGSRWMRL